MSVYYMFVLRNSRYVIGQCCQSDHLCMYRASAMQSLVQLMGEQELFEYWRDTDKVRRLSSQWTVDKAVAVLRAWKGNFTQVGDATKSSLTLGWRRCS